jgi:predicted peroxiredoxin
MNSFKKKEIKAYGGTIYPRIQKKIKKASEKGVNFVVAPSRGIKLKVEHCNKSLVICDLDAKTCP